MRSSVRTSVVNAMPLASLMTSASHSVNGPTAGDRKPWRCLGLARLNEQENAP